MSPLVTHAFQRGSMSVPQPHIHSTMGLTHQVPAGHSGQAGSQRFLKPSPAQAQGPCRSQGNSVLTADPGTDFSLSIHATEPDIPMSHPQLSLPRPSPTQGRCQAGLGCWSVWARALSWA